MEEEVGWPAWTAQVDDTVGGFIVTTYPYPASQHDFRRDGDPLHAGYVIADTMTRADAEKMAQLLNEAKYVPEIAYSELADKFRWVTAGYLEGTLRKKEC